MKTRSVLSFLLLTLVFITVSAKEKTKLKWWDPADSKMYVINGQAWPGRTESLYDRLPADAKNKVREPVWKLSKNSAGLTIRFISNSPKIVVRYKVIGSLAMPHMPATGVSGVDLYARSTVGEWEWCKGNRSFGDTVTYTFRGLPVKDAYHSKGRVYTLYLPLYNSVEWLEIGHKENSAFVPLKKRKEKPIVVYGTSIAQGACASRPGMAWTALLERKMDRPLINLGFSGNGRLEPEMIDLIAQIDAKVYVLDCLPNLVLGKKYTAKEVYNRITRSVKQLKEKRPDVPILLVDHASIHPDLNEVSHRAFADLKASGVNGLFLLTHNDIGLYYDSFVDGTHPSDYGMEGYANAYEKTLREILNEPVGDISTEIPVPQNRDANTYNWNDRHQELLEMNSKKAPDVCFFGNSITHFWGGEPVAERQNGEKSWEKYFGKMNIRNFGFGWDRVENVLWRVYHDELDGYKAKQIILMIGTNNINIHDSDEKIAEGIRFLIDAMKTRQPDAKILLLGIYPGKGREKRVAELNLKLAQMAELEQIDYADIGGVLLRDDGKIKENLFVDGLHPNNDGYDLLGAQIVKLIKQ